MARLQPITSKEQVPEKDHAIVDAIAQSRGAIQGPFTMFLHCPELAGRVAHLGALVRFEGSLDMRARVLAAMTVAREFEAVMSGVLRPAARGARECRRRRLRRSARTTLAASRRKTPKSSTSPGNSCVSTGLTTRPPAHFAGGSAIRGLSS
jgi:hypothetical protein